MQRSVLMILFDVVCKIKMTTDWSEEA